MTAAAPGAEAPALLVEHVSKSFPRRRTVRELVRHPLRRPDRVQALQDITLDVRAGELMGLLGPNGAGKTTLLKILCGLIVPNVGTVSAFGEDLSASRLPSVIGLVHGDERSFYWRLSARENLNFFARLHGLRQPVREQQVEELLARVDLQREANRRFGDFSSGMRQRLAIARALLADPPILLMDEPTRSLDPVSAARLRDWIRDELHHKDGKSIVLATHNLREAETLCQRVAIVSRGSVRAIASPAELRRRGLAGICYRVRLSAPPAREPETGRVIGRTTREDGSCELLVRIAGPRELDPLLAELRELGGPLLGCSHDEPDLEEVFRALVENENEDEGDGARPGESAP